MTCSNTKSVVIDTKSVVLNRCEAERVRDAVLWQPARPSIEPLVASAASAAIAANTDQGMNVG